MAGFATMGGVATALAGCTGGPDTAAGPSLTPEALAAEYVRLTLALARQQPSLVEVWLGPPDQASGPRVPAPQLRAEAAALLAQAEDLAARTERVAGPAGVGDPMRVAYLVGQVRALDEAAGRLVGEGHPFQEEARRSFGHTAPPRDASGLDVVRRSLDDLLPGPGSLADRHATFRRAAAVPPERVEEVFRAAVDWCRREAAARLPLPDGESLTTRAEDTTGWAAFSRPTGPLTSDLWVAKGGGADAAHLLQLAAHEGTPGHHAQLVLASDALVTGRGWTERLLLPSFGPHRLLAEGAAEAGAALLLPVEVREAVCRDVLLPAAGQPPSMAGTLVRVERLAAELDLEVAYIAADYLDTAARAVDVADRLREDALVLDPGGMVSFIEKQRTKILAYPVGRRLVLDRIGGGEEAGRWDRLAAISTTLTLPGAGLE